MSHENNKPTESDDKKPKEKSLADAPCSPVPVTPKRKRGESKYAYEQRLENWKIDQALTRKANHMRGTSDGNRNIPWRIAEAERREFGEDDAQW